MLLRPTNWPLQSQCPAFYGHSGNAAGANFDIKWLHENVVHVACPWVLTDLHNHFGSISIHRKCAESLNRVLHSIYAKAGGTQEAIEKLGYDVFSGSGNYRPMRTSSALSMHAYFAAIDWDAPENPLHAQRHRFQPDALLFVEFRAEGWVCGVDWRDASIDTMHVQAARVG